MKAEHQKLFDEGVSASELGAVIGISARRVTQLATAGVFRKLSRGRFSPVLDKYILHREEGAALQRNRTHESEQIVEEKLRRLRRLNDVAERVLIPVGDAVDAIAAILGPVQAELATIPVHSSDDRRERANIESAIDEIVNKLARQIRRMDQAQNTKS